MKRRRAIADRKFKIDKYTIQDNNSLVIGESTTSSGRAVLTLSAQTRSGEPLGRVCLDAPQTLRLILDAMDWFERQREAGRPKEHAQKYGKLPLPEVFNKEFP